MNLNCALVFLCMINQMRPAGLAFLCCLHFSCLKSLMDAQVSSSLSISRQHLTPLKPISPRSTKDVRPFGLAYRLFFFRVFHSFIGIFP